MNCTFCGRQTFITVSLTDDERAELSKKNAEQNKRSENNRR
ncbi:hypothetical protein OHA46_33720 (plasmid) [Streptomyces sp. NBC_00708]